MGKIVEQIINRFDGGISEDQRVNSSNKYSLTKHFDAFTYPHKLVPYYKTEAANGTTNLTTFKTYKIVKFLYAPWLSSGAYRLYGYGVVVGSTQPKVYNFDIDAGDPANTSWGTPSNGESATTGRNEDAFFYYKQFIYMWNARYLMRFDTTVSAAWNETYYDSGAGGLTSVAQPVHHSADDVAYFFHDNFVSSLNDTTWSAKVLTLPSDMKIVSCCEHGNYLAIGCVTKGALNAKSVAFLWDRDSSLTTLTERINFGDGVLRQLASLKGQLTAVIDGYTNNFYSLDSGKIYIRQASGGNTSVTTTTLTLDNDQTNPFSATKFVSDDKLYFPMGATRDSDTRLGIWVVDHTGKATLDYVEESATQYNGIIRLGNMWFISHSTDGSVTRTDENGGYTNTSIYESLKFTLDDPSKKKKLISASVMFEPLPAAGQVVLKYKKDEETSWTTIYTYTTDSGISHSAINIESSGATLPEFKEIKFRIESTGGAAITGLKYRAEILDKDLT